MLCRASAHSAASVRRLPGQRFPREAAAEVRLRRPRLLADGDPVRVSVIAVLTLRRTPAEAARSTRRCSPGSRRATLNIGALPVDPLSSVMILVITGIGSTPKDAPMFRSPDVIHVNTVCSIARFGRPAHPPHGGQPRSERQPAVARQATPPETDLGSRFPRKALTRLSASGQRRGLSASTDSRPLTTSGL